MISLLGPGRDRPLLDIRRIPSRDGIDRHQGLAFSSRDASISRGRYASCDGARTDMDVPVIRSAAARSRYPCPENSQVLVDRVDRRLPVERDRLADLPVVCIQPSDSNRPRSRTRSSIVRRRRADRHRDRRSRVDVQPTLVPDALLARANSRVKAELELRFVPVE